MPRSEAPKTSGKQLQMIELGWNTVKIDKIVCLNLPGMHMNIKEHLQRVLLSRTTYSLLFITIGLSYLYVYTRLIGRPDIFISALNSSAIVIYILALLAVMGVAALTIFTLPSYFLILACDRSTIDARMSDKYNYRACITAAFGVILLLAVFVAVVIVDVQTGFSTTAPEIFLIFTALMAMLYTLLVRKEIRVKVKHHGKIPGFAKIIFVHFQVLFLLSVSALMSFYVADLVFRFNDWEENWLDYILIITYCFLCMTATLSPAFFYLQARKHPTKEKQKNVNNQIFGLFIGWVISTTILIFCTGNLLGAAALNLGKGLGITDDTARYYQVSSDYKNRLSIAHWGEYEDNGNTITMQGKLLFNFGSIRLLCPASLDISWSQIDQVQSTAKRCFSFQRADLTKLDVVTGGNHK